eukprot:886002-Amorphochlora_amoeboformis.AAC.1
MQKSRDSHGYFRVLSYENPRGISDVKSRGICTLADGSDVVYLIFSGYYNHSAGANLRGFVALSGNVHVQIWLNFNV